MPTRASEITSKAGIILQDTTHVRWPLAELYQWINDGQREVVMYKPEACVINEVINLEGGLTKQQLRAPNDTNGVARVPVRLLELTRNYGLVSKSSTPGKAIRFIDRTVMDAQNPDWHTLSTSDGVILHYMHDPRDPLTFYVYPKPWAATRVEAVYSFMPTPVSSPSTNLSVADIFSNAVLDYVLFRCYSKDAEFAGNGDRAMSHYNAFANAVGIKWQVDLDVSPAANEKTTYIKE